MGRLLRVQEGFHRTNKQGNQEAGLVAGRGVKYRTAIRGVGVCPVMRCVPVLLLGFLGCVRAPPERGVSTSSCPGPHFLLHLTMTAEPLLCRVALTVLGPPPPHPHQPLLFDVFLVIAMPAGVRSSLCCLHLYFPDECC